jgi:hypothetical protein
VYILIANNKTLAAFSEPTAASSALLLLHTRKDNNGWVTYNGVHLNPQFARIEYVPEWQDSLVGKKGGVGQRRGV